MKKKVEVLKQNLKAAMENEILQAAEFEGGEFFDTDRKRAGGGARPPKKCKGSS